MEKEKASLFLTLGESSFELLARGAGKWLPRPVLREEEAGLRHLGQREKVLEPGLLLEFRLGEVTGGAAPSSCYAPQVRGWGCKAAADWPSRGCAAVADWLRGAGRGLWAPTLQPRAGWWGRRTGVERGKTATSAGEGSCFGSSVL